MNTLVVGDVHLKTSKILPSLERLIPANDVKKVIFVGDYFDNWGADSSVYYDEINKLIEYKMSLLYREIEVTFLCGNHDYAYINPICQGCSGNNPKMREFAYGRLTEYLNVQYADFIPRKHQENDILVTHAGLSKYWAMEQELPIDSNAFDLSGELNKMFNKALKIIEKCDFHKDLSLNEHKLLHNLEACSGYRGGLDRFSSPLWCDIRELDGITYPNLNQIIGHTPVKTCFKIDNDDGSFIWACDTHSTRPGEDGKEENIGDCSMLLVTDSDIIKVI